MPRADAAAIPDHRTCEQARLSRDPRFDGLFFTAVTSTRIYCRPVCPVRAPRPENVRYYPSAAAAEAAGFRPCLRCRPELAPGTAHHGDALVARALALIDEGFLAEQRVAALAARLGLGERQLRRLFVTHLGASPGSVHATRRLLFAKRLLTETRLPIIDVALESGFQSVRRFNASFRETYRLSPRDLRRRPLVPDAGNGLSLRLDYRPPYDLAGQLAFLSDNAIPGVEQVDGQGYARSFGPPDAPGWLRVEACTDDRDALRLHLHCPQPTHLQRTVARVRRMFDLDAQPQVVADALAADPELRPLLQRHPGRRLPGAWDGLECLVLAVLARWHGLEAARRLAGRLARRFGHPLPDNFPSGLMYLFPDAATLAQVPMETQGIAPRAARDLRRLAAALHEGRADLRADRSLQDLLEQWQALPGVDAGIAHCLAMRAASQPDALPWDARLYRPLSGADASRPIDPDASARWRPWRAYAAMLLRDAPAGRVPRADVPHRDTGGMSRRRRAP